MKLTKRQQQVFELCNLGLSSNEIAEQLNISPRTVKSHIGDIVWKVGAKNKRGLINAIEKNNFFIINCRGNHNIGEFVSISFNQAEYTDPALSAESYRGTRCWQAGGDTPDPDA